MGDTIAAVATPMARGAIGILRLSGPEAVRAASAVFKSVSGRALEEYEGRRLVYGTLYDREGNAIDQVLATYTRGPGSYTGEDTAELQCHGSPAVLTLGLEALFAQGVRQAGPGEFTRRAFLNGRLDLTQAEAVADLIDAETASAVRQAAGQLSGALGRRVAAVYDALTDLTAHFCAVLDYPDEDIDPFRAETMERALSQAQRELSALLATYGRGRQLVHGVPCAIVGRPNAGKSSLLNALVGYDRAIVTDIPGTTRDTVEESVLCGGVELRLIDTAGIRETDDTVEQMGVERSRRAVAEADLVLVVVDISEIPTLEHDETLRLARASGKPFVVVFSKLDLYKPPAHVTVPGTGGDPAGAVYLSAVTGEGLQVLEDTVAGLFPQGSAPDGSILTNQRQEDAARRALDAVERAREALASGFTPDAILTDAEEALDALGELTGRTAREEIVSGIFSRFCVGK